MNDELQKVSEETMRFMRGKYVLDEVAGKYYDIDCLKFRQGKKTILSINIHEDHYDFQIIYGKAEREKFEARLAEFPATIQELYKQSKALHDGLWMLIRVDNLEMLEALKQMIMIKKRPNRKPFPKEQAVYADCGEFACCQPQAGLKGKIEHKSILAADVTWAILPYVDGQYGN